MPKKTIGQSDFPEPEPEPVPNFGWPLKASRARGWTVYSRGYGQPEWTYKSGSMVKLPGDPVLGVASTRRRDCAKLVLPAIKRRHPPLVAALYYRVEAAVRVLTCRKQAGAPGNVAKSGAASKSPSTVPILARSSGCRTDTAIGTQPRQCAIGVRRRRPSCATTERSEINHRRDDRLRMPQERRFIRSPCNRYESSMDSAPCSSSRRGESCDLSPCSVSDVEGLRQRRLLGYRRFGAQCAKRPAGDAVMITRTSSCAYPKLAPGKRVPYAQNRRARSPALASRCM